MKAPSKSITDNEIKSLLENGPLIGSPKYDGFRGFIDPENGTLLSNARKPYGNKFVQSEMSKKCYSGLDGEFIVGDPTDPEVFKNSSSALRRQSGEPEFTFYVFDSMLDPTMPYEQRMSALEAYAYLPYIEVVPSVYLETLEDVIEYETEMLMLGYEGIMLRDPQGVYKFGRATMKEANIFKRKPFADCEAVIVAVNEMMENQNEKVVNEMGRSKRSSCQDGKVGKDTLGSFTLKSPLWENEFNCGTMLGVTLEDRFDMWAEKESLIGQTVTLKYQSYGSVDAPRIPVFLRFRPEFDME